MWRFIASIIVLPLSWADAAPPWIYTCRRSNARITGRTGAHRPGPTRSQIDLSPSPAP